MKLIPTPQKYTHSEARSPILGFSQIQCRVDQDETIRWALETLQKELPHTAGNAVLVLKKGDDAFFSEKNAKEQGYILCREGNTVTLTAQTSLGFLYGLMTMLQLGEEAPASFCIYDRPQIRFRGNMNTLWAESGVWSYDFGDGLENACRRMRIALDQAAKFKLNLMYIDLGYKTERFPGHDATLSSLAEYGRVRGVRLMFGGYGMGYGQSGHSNSYFGKVFRNREPYPDGEIYDCIGTFPPALDSETFPHADASGVLKGRSYGTCLSNTALTDDKIAEIREYMQATGARVLYLHHLDTDHIDQPFWTARCARCKEAFPNENLYAADGAAGAFAQFFDRMLDKLLPEFPDFILCPISPGYGSIGTTDDADFDKCVKFWAAVKKFSRYQECLIPTFRELLYQMDEPKLRYDILHENMAHFGCVYFPGSDGFYSDKIFNPSAAYTAVMQDCDLMISSCGHGLQKATHLANAEYFWNPSHSAFWNLEPAPDYESMVKHYDDFRFGRIRPEGIYGEDGLLETACMRLYGKAHGKRIAEALRLYGSETDACPVLTSCTRELWTNNTRRNFPFLWDTPVDAQQQEMYRARFAEAAPLTQQAADIFAEVLTYDDLDENTREHVAFLQYATTHCAEQCRQFSRYMELYVEADLHFEKGTPVAEDIYQRAEQLAVDAEKYLELLRAENRKPFDPMGGIHIRREESFDFVAYASRQIIKSLKTGQRIPEDRRPLKTGTWW